MKNHQFNNTTKDSRKARSCAKYLTPETVRLPIGGRTERNQTHVVNKTVFVLECTAGYICISSSGKLHHASDLTMNTWEKGRPTQSTNQSFNVMFHANTGQTLTRTSRRPNSRSAAIDRSKFNHFNSLSTHSFQVFLPRTLPTLPVTSYSVQRLTQSILSFSCTSP